jgi:hypothetical protein
MEVCRAAGRFLEDARVLRARFSALTEPAVRAPAAAHAQGLLQ